MERAKRPRENLILYARIDFILFVLYFSRLPRAVIAFPFSLFFFYSHPLFILVRHLNGMKRARVQRGVAYDALRKWFIYNTFYFYPFYIRYITAASPADKFSSYVTFLERNSHGKAFRTYIGIHACTKCAFNNTVKGIIFFEMQQ